MPTGWNIVEWSAVETLHRYDASGFGEYRDTVKSTPYTERAALRIVGYVTSSVEEVEPLADWQPDLCFGTACA